MSKLLRAGAAEVDITPARGIQIAGNIGVLRPTEEILEPLLAKALVLESEGRRICILSTDVLAIRGDYAAEIRRRARERHGFDASDVLVHCTQNHSAPSVGHCFCLDESFWRQWIAEDLDWVLGGDKRYNEPFVESLMTAIGRALRNLKPASISVGRGVDGRMAFNRRCIMRDGTAQCHPPICDPKILQVEGPADPEVALALLRDESGNCLAALLHFSCHTQQNVGARSITSGWPGTWCDLMRKALPGATPIVLNGCCGNLHPRNPISPIQATYHEMGAMLSETSRKVLDALEKKETPADGPALIESRVKRLRIPLRDLDPAAVESARVLLEKNPRPMWLDAEKTRIDWAWIYAISMLDLARHRAQQPFYDYEIQVFRIGNLAVVALTGEPFVEGQLEIKLNSPAPYTQIAHMSNGYVGYIPTRAALKRGGYETRTAHWSKLAPEALEMIVRETLGTLGELYPKM